MVSWRGLEACHRGGGGLKRLQETAVAGCHVPCCVTEVHLGHITKLVLGHMSPLYPGDIEPSRSMKQATEAGLCLPCSRFSTSQAQIMCLNAHVQNVQNAVQITVQKCLFAVLIMMQDRSRQITVQITVL